MKTLALRLDSMNHTSYKLFIVPCSPGLLLRVLLSPHGCRAFWNSRQWSPFPCCSPRSDCGGPQKAWAYRLRQRSDGSSPANHSNPRRPQNNVTAPSVNQRHWAYLSRQPVTYKDACPSESGGGLSLSIRSLQTHSCWCMCSGGCFSLDALFRGSSDWRLLPCWGALWEAPQSSAGECLAFGIRPKTTPTPTHPTTKGYSTKGHYYFLGLQSQCI